MTVDPFMTYAATRLVVDQATSALPDAPALTPVTQSSAPVLRRGGQHRWWWMLDTRRSHRCHSRAFGCGLRSRLLSYRATGALAASGVEDRLAHR